MFSLTAPFPPSSQVFPISFSCCISFCFFILFSSWSPHSTIYFFFSFFYLGISMTQPFVRGFRAPVQAAVWLVKILCPGSFRHWPCLTSSSVCCVPKLVASESSPSPSSILLITQVPLISQQPSLFSQCWCQLGLPVRTDLWKCLLDILRRWRWCQLAVLPRSWMAADYLLCLTPTALSQAAFLPALQHWLRGGKMVYYSSSVRWSSLLWIQSLWCLWWPAILCEANIYG